MGCCASKPQAHGLAVYKRQPLQTGWDVHGHVLLEATGRRFVIIGNPKSGAKRGAQVMEMARVALTEAGAEVRVYETEYSGHAMEMARTRIWSQWGDGRIDGLTVCGGDGTVHEVVNGLFHGLLERRAAAKARGASDEALPGLEEIPALGIFPSGSGNTFAYTLGWADPEEGIQNVIRGRIRGVDVVEMTPLDGVPCPSLADARPAPLPPAVDASGHAVGAAPARGSGGSGGAAAALAAPVTGRSSAEVAVSVVASAGGISLSDVVTETPAEGAVSGSPKPSPLADASLIASASSAASESSASSASATVAAEPAPAGAGATVPRLAPATLAASAGPLDLATQSVRHRVLYSVNMIGYGLSSAVLATANDLRSCCGGAAYNCAAYKQLCANPTYQVRLLAPRGTVVYPFAPPVPGSTTAAASASSASGAAPAAAGVSASSAASSAATSTASASAAEGPAVSNEIEGASTGASLRAPLVGSGSDKELVPGGPLQEVAGGEWIMIQMQITVHMGERMAFCPRAVVDDGLLDVTAVRPTGRCRMVSVMELAKDDGAHVEPTPQPEIVYFQAPEVHLIPSERELTGPGTVNVDGELSGPSPVRCRVLPSILRVFA